MVKKESFKNSTSDELLQFMGANCAENVIGKAVISLLKAGKNVTCQSIIDELDNSTADKQHFNQPIIDLLRSLQKSS